MNKAQNIDKALSYCYQLFNFRLRSRKELIQKLQLRGYGSTVIEEIVSSLSQQGLINDERFAKLWAQSRIRTRPSSLVIIRQELLKKGITSETVDDVLGQIKSDFDEYKIARGLTQKRMHVLSSVNKLKAKKRLFDYLKRRAFSSEVISRILDEEFKNET